MHRQHKIVITRLDEKRVLAKRAVQAKDTDLDLNGKCGQSKTCVRFVALYYMCHVLGKGTTCRLGLILSCSTYECNLNFSTMCTSQNEEIYKIIDFYLRKTIQIAKITILRKLRLPFGNRTQPHTHHNNLKSIFKPFLDNKT